MTTISPYDRGLHYGDGVFETIAVRGGRPLRARRHLDRLAAGCRRLGIAQPSVGEAELRRACADAGDAVLKLIVTRGDGARGYRPPPDAAPSCLLSLYPRPASGGPVALRWCTLRLAVQPALAGIKHLNRLEQVLARAEWADDDAWQDGVMCDADGHPVETTTANLFVVRGGRVLTPRVDRCGVAGIVRGVLLDAGAATEAVLTRADVDGADEAFITNSVHGVRAVRRIGDRELTAPGPAARDAARTLAATDDE